MSEQEWYLEGRQKPSLRAWAFSQMALGAAYAGCVLVAIMAFMMILYAVGTILPEASKEAPAPMPPIEAPFGRQADQ
ncbi:RC-LH1 core complex protein PufX [Anianabacter salinae]|uniref:RC-LH1 core complex protein PufX n=1 Tax=Anianabacter salinae TaxID=2851023 RepID=UPI00225E38B1|nr:RC-LH1 core complex protein PufX [Anianabacter salinae]MBV0914149.1 RC-LH1 core complex protein PufX [Anianabacter salinae]